MSAVNPVTASWLIQAYEDLRSALALLDVDAWSNSSMLAQQAAEKFAKAILLHGGVVPPMTHNLLKLNDAIASAGLAELTDAHRQAAADLTKVFSTSRYPQLELESAPCQIYTRMDALNALRCAALFFDLAVALMPGAVATVLPGKREGFAAAWIKLSSMTAP